MKKQLCEKLCSKINQKGAYREKIRKNLTIFITLKSKKVPFLAFEKHDSRSFIFELWLDAPWVQSRSYISVILFIEKVVISSTIILVLGSLFIKKVVIGSIVLFVINHKFSKPFFKDIINHTLRHVNSRLPAKVIGDFSTLEREKAILS